MNGHLSAVLIEMPADFRQEVKRLKRVGTFLEIPLMDLRLLVEEEEVEPKKAEAKQVENGDESEDQDKDNLSKAIRK